MLVVVGGQERTEREYQALFEQAGFVLARTIPTMSTMTLIEALPKLAPFVRPSMVPLVPEILPQ